MNRLLTSAFLVLLGVAGMMAQSFPLSGSGYDMHAEINWPAQPQADRYNVYRRGPGESDFSAFRTTATRRVMDWTGRSGDEPMTYAYYVDALTLTGQLIGRSDTAVVDVQPLDEEGWLDMVQAYTLRYFWEHAHPVSGMARERYGSGDVVTTGGTGFGVMAIIVGIHRGWIDREAGVDRLLQLVSFLQFAEKFHGVFPHWINGKTGKTIPFSQFDNGGDLVETAFLFEGLLCARTYFDGDNDKENTLRSVITSLWEDVEWDHYTRNNSGVLYWHWSPNYGWQMNFQIRGHNEAMMPYLLGIASPTHAIPATYWKTGWAGGNYVNGFSWYGYTLWVGPPLGGPLFFAHYSYQGFDPRNIRDEFANYFEQNKNHTLINRSWCISNPLRHEGYSDVSWGLTASDNPWGYSAHAPGGTTDNGTLTPTAALSSMPYTPTESLDAMIHFYRTYGDRLWGEYGFRDAFNPGEDWFATSYLAIDQGPIVNMIENYRSGLLWSLFMANPEIAPALADMGFHPDATGTTGPDNVDMEWSVSPTVTEGWITINTADLAETSGWTISIITPDGREVFAGKLVPGQAQTSIDLKATGLPSGLAFILLRHADAGVSSRGVILN